MAASEVMSFDGFGVNTPILIESDQPVQMSVQDVLKMLAPDAPPVDALKFLLTCKAARLNPFLGEAFLVLMGRKTPRWMTVISKAGYLKRAQSYPQYDGHESGIVAQRIIDAKSGQFGEEIEVVGTILPRGFVLTGGWAKVYRKGVSRPTYKRLSMDEYDKKAATWETNPCTMIEKTAIVHAIRETFAIGDSYDESEFEPAHARQITGAPETRNRDGDNIGSLRQVNGAGPQLAIEGAGQSDQATQEGRVEAAETAPAEAASKPPPSIYDADAPPITAEQVNQLWDLIEGLGLSVDQVKTILRPMGAQSVEHLDSWAATKLIADLESRKSVGDFAESIGINGGAAESVTSAEIAAGAPVDSFEVADAPRREKPEKGASKKAKNKPDGVSVAESLPN